MTKKLKKTKFWTFEVFLIKKTEKPRFFEAIFQPWKLNIKNTYLKIASLHAVLKYAGDGGNFHNVIGAMPMITRLMY